MKAIGYVRVSSDDQIHGHGIPRQRQAIEDYCKRNDLDLIEVLIDDGYSAFKGEHLSKGEFGRLLKKADKGEYSGNALVTENQDRLSRLALLSDTTALLSRIHKAGLQIHYTQSGRIVRSPEDFPTAIMDLVEAEVGRQHSIKLTDRLQKKWAEKKHESKPGTSITGKLPGWLVGKTGEPIRVDKERAKIVRRIFDMAAAGHGRRLIARRLNQEGVPTFGAGKRKAEIWHDSYVQKILTNPAVLGTYQPFKRVNGTRVPDGEPREDFFPAVITQDLWDRAQKSTATRREPNDAGAFAGRAGKINNLFSGLVYDETLGGLPMYYEDKGKRSRPKLVTDSKNRNGTKGNSIPYARFEKAFLSFLDDLDWSNIVDIADSSEIKKLESEIADLNGGISRSQAQIQTLVDKLLTLDTPASALNDRLLRLEATVAEDKSVLAMAEKQVEAAKGKHRDLLDKSVLYASLSKSKDIETRSRLRQEIRRKVSRIEMNFGLDGWFCVVEVKFINNAMRGIIFTQDAKTLVLRGEGTP
jgi:DNA invertase Pin-like site-specific DNA recombinase